MYIMERWRSMINVHRGRVRHNPNIMAQCSKHNAAALIIVPVFVHVCLVMYFKAPFDANKVILGLYTLCILRNTLMYTSYYSNL